MSSSEAVTSVANAATHNYLSFFSLLTSTDLVGKFVIGILVLSSICTWAIIFEKSLKIRGIKKKILNFENTFWSGQVLDQLYETSKRNVDDPLSSIFVSAMNEFKRGISPKSGEFTSLKIGHKDRIFQAMNLIKNKEIEFLSKNLVFLATIGSSATFIGLFGTVWGIMHSFQSIAASKNTTLAVVAPGISEALFVTAIGLAVAIPASTSYNFLLSKINNIGNKIEDFMTELDTILSRAIDEERS